jgi:hypothetical protein
MMFLPSCEEMLECAQTEIERAYRALEQAADWLRLDRTQPVRR